MAVLFISGDFKNKKSKKFLSSSFKVPLFDNAMNASLDVDQVLTGMSGGKCSFFLVLAVFPSLISLFILSQNCVYFPLKPFSTIWVKRLKNVVVGRYCLSNSDSKPLKLVIFLDFVGSLPLRLSVAMYFLIIFLPAPS